MCEIWVGRFVILCLFKINFVQVLEVIEMMIGVGKKISKWEGSPLGITINFDIKIQQFPKNFCY